MSESPAGPIQSRGDLLAAVAASGLEHVSRCFQCKKCTNGCPLTFAMDAMPNQVIRLVQMGLREEALRTRTIWVCAACETCTARCPNQIDIAGVMDVLRQLAVREGVPPAEPKIPVFHAKFLRSIARRGRVFELGLVAGYKWGSGDLWTDVDMGLTLLAKGRLPLLPHRVRDRQAVRALFRQGGPS